MRHGNLFVISGPSGAGKGTLVARLLREVPDAWVSRSVTTRAPREGEVDGVHYQFASAEEFQDLVDTDGLLEWATYAGNRYGTPRATVEDHMACGEQDALYAANVRLADKLTALGADIRFEHWTGIHNWEFWDAAVRKALDHLL